MPYKNLDKAWETRYFVWKIENFNDLKLPQSLIISAKILHMFPTYQCLQKGI